MSKFSAFCLCDSCVKKRLYSCCKFRRFLRKKSAIFEEKMECENEKKECDMKKAASEKGGSNTTTTVYYYYYHTD